MATLTVLKFQTPDGADQALSTLKALQQQELITVIDAAVVRWLPGKKSPQTQQANSLVGVGALNGAFWGMLFGLIFFIPFFGLAIGAAMGALGAHFADYGIDDNFIKQVRNEVTEGTSAIFVMSTGAQPERVVNALRPLNPEIISTNLSAEQEAELREMFAPVEAAVEAGDGTEAQAQAQPQAQAQA
jgi:uncharacterized membrane protein